MRWLFVLCLLATPAWADSDLHPSLSIDLRDEGAGQGQIKRLDCVGANIVCAKSGVTGTVTISGGGGSITVREVDGTPSVTSVTTVEFDQGAGFIITDQTGGVARVSSSGGGGGLSHAQVMSRVSGGF